ncbi:MAG: hypothetical protein L0Y35_03225, partial [Flammeovirgaceae bacterium]|nr:hypothetical protein [Flammeovirgaceae bacterium]
TKKEEAIVVAGEEELPINDVSFGKEKLSDYGFFHIPLKNLEPVEGVVHYSINAQLFSDYALKKRFVKIPQGAKAIFNHTEVFEFPVGSVLIKNFYYPADFNKPEETVRILETRLLIRELNGWIALPYVWNNKQTDAFLNVAGESIDVSWKHTDGQIKNISYSVPNVNQCKGCHLKGDQITPIGLSARQLNKNEADENQLVNWHQASLIDQLPDLNSIAALTNYDNKNESTEKRARAWLEINCAHCHRPDGPAKTSGLHLNASVTNAYELGIGKAPVAAGKGSGGRLFSIVPGKPDESILQFRIESTHPGIMMPEMGRKLVHQEGVDLVRQWIREMK